LVDGLLNLDKPPEMTSRAVVDAVVRVVGRKVKVGHAGTLDPLATGVLVVALGAATRLIEYVQRMPKTYRAGIRLGAVSTTDDADGEVTPVEGATPPDEGALRVVLAAQVGTIDQLPPQFSALKVEGRRAYDLAREGEAVALKARPVRIDRVELRSYAWPDLEIEVDCGAGTYIRSIARDAGAALGCGGHITALRRTRIGTFAEADALKLADLSIEAIRAHVRPMADAVATLPRITVDADGVARIVRGQTVAAPGPALEPGVEVALVTADGTLVALGEPAGEGGRVRPRKVFAANPLNP
jgi:tRNA pseudouridine55 synthase